MCQVVNEHETGLLAQAAARAAKYTGSVLVKAAYESEPKRRVLFWSGARPYVVIGRRQARHREYLTSFESYYDGELFIFTSSTQ